jgi:hypothetical protein
MAKKKHARTKDSSKARRLAGLEELAAEWDRRLAVLNQPGSHERLEAVMAAEGRLKRRPRAGSSF